MTNYQSLSALLLLAASGLPTLAQAQTVNYASPIVITKGGTYTGNYRSLASDVPCIQIATNDPVILDGCVLAGAGNLIQAGENVNLTVRNCQGQGLTPSVNNQAPGRFLDVYKAYNLVVEHNILTQTSGIVINRWSDNKQAGQTLTVRYNQARNIDGRWRNGGSTRSSFVLLNTVQHVAGVNIAYNEVINTANESLVEDNINLYNSSGTAQSSLRVHNNFVRGAYPYPATSKGFTGTGMTTDGDAQTLAEAAGYIEADHNQFVGTGNAAMNLAAGHDISYHDNRVVTSGTLPNGQRFNAGWAGIGVFNYYNQPSNVFFNNRVENNTVGYVSWGSNSPYTDRLDLSPGACAPCTGTISLPNPITTATEDAEQTLWQQKLQQAGVTVGPISASPTPTTPAGVVVNPGFELDNSAVGSPTGWLTQTWNGANDNADYTETYGGAHTGTYHGTHYRPEAYEVYTYQKVSSLANGTYKFSAWMMSSGGQSVAQLQAKNYGGAALATNVSGTNGSWVLVELNNIVVSNGQCEIGFYSKTNAGGQWLYFDDVTLVPQTAASTISLFNTSFDDDNAPVQSPQRWTTQTWGNTQAYASYTEAQPGAHTGTYHGTHYRPESYKVYTYQTVSGLANGTYSLSAWVKSSGGQPAAQLQANNYGKGSSAVDAPATPDGQWAQITIPNIVVSNGQCEVGFYSQANAGQWLYFDDIALVKQGATTNTASLAMDEVASTAALYPNPANDQVTITTSFAQATQVALVITDLQGTLIAKYNKQATSGSNQFSLNTSDLPNGIYILQIQSDQTSTVQHLEVRH